MNYGPASKYYDLFASMDDIDFYRRLAVEHGRKALELGVGTGRVAIALAKANVTVWGIDNSKYMLSVARQKLRKESNSVRKRVTLKLGDMRTFRLEETFPFIYLASSTFEHCTMEKDQKKCLESAYNTLARQGILAFDISQPSEAKPDSVWWIDQREASTEEEVVRMILSRRNPNTGIVSVNLFFDAYRNGKLKERYHEYGEARISSKEDVARILEKAGFEVCEVYGDFQGSPYNKGSQRAIFVAKKP